MLSTNSNLSFKNTSLEIFRESRDFRHSPPISESTLRRELDAWTEQFVKSLGHNFAQRFQKES